MTSGKNEESDTFEELARQHHRRLLAYTLGLVRNETVAQDIVQEALLTAYIRFESFDQNQSFAAWVRGICRNKYREWCRHNNKYVYDDLALDQLEQTHCDWDNLETERNDSLRVLSACIETLSSAAKKVVNAFYMKQVNCNELAKESDEPVSTIHKRLQRARESLLRCVKESLKAEKRWGRS